MVAGIMQNNVTYGFERFSAFQSCLHITGWIAGPNIGTAVIHQNNINEHSINLHWTDNKWVFDQLIQLNSYIGIEDCDLKIYLTDGKTVTFNNISDPPAEPVHHLANKFFSIINSIPDGHLLEIGSRARSGISRRNLTPAGWQYTGCDILAGPNVDVVGDAHKLSQLFPPNTFNAMMTFSVLEHLIMPWKFCIELNRVLAKDAICLIMTHQAWPIHEMPWDFWRFTDQAWHSLLNKATGFEIIEAQMGQPAYVVPKHLSPTTNFREEYIGNLLSVVLFRKVSDTTLQWPVDVEDITTTMYPATVG